MNKLKVLLKKKRFKNVYDHGNTFFYISIQNEFVSVLVKMIEIVE